MKINITIATQQLDLLDEHGQIVRQYRISSAKNGTGQENGSFCTPLGKHIIRAKIGAGQPVNTVFIKRRPTGEIYSPEFAAQFPRRDWILTRILWLCGCEPGFNRFGTVDTMHRYIYIHGTGEEGKIGAPASHGCIRMRNQAVIDLFDRVDENTLVVIVQKQGG